MISPILDSSLSRRMRLISSVQGGFTVQGILSPPKTELKLLAMSNFLWWILKTLLDPQYLIYTLGFLILQCISIGSHPYKVSPMLLGLEGSM